MFRYRLVILSTFLTASTSAPAGEALEVYAQRCDEAIGIAVPDFNCDAGTLVPTTHMSPASASYPNGACDRPDQLNKECDAGSRFQVLPGSNDRAFAVAHCRKQGLGSGEYGDIAVIQHNKDNGTTCFYQALADWQDWSTRKIRVPLRRDVEAPSQGTSAWPWLTPEKTAHIGCSGCHDNGPIIRSPYLSQVMKDGQPFLPGAGDGTFNDDQPYHFVGTDFASWKAYKVEVPDNTCNGCHRMGISTIVPPTFPAPTGTARDLGIRATATSQPNKNPHSTASPIWTWGMKIVDPPDVLYDQALADAAKAIKDCAETFRADAPLSNTPTCKITRFTGSNEFAPLIEDRFGLAVATWGPSRLDLFGVGTNGAMYHKAWDGIWRPSPSGWEHLGGIFTSPPAVVASGPERLDLFGLGTDHSLFHTAWAPDTGWTSWETLGGTFASPPAVVSWGPNRLDIFGVGTDGAMYHKAWDGAWHPSPSGWEHLGGIFTSPPAVVAWGSHWLDVFGLGTDRSLFHRAWTPDTGWTAWEALGGIFTGTPVVASRDPNRLDILGIGRDAALYQKTWDGSTWLPSPRDWRRLGSGVLAGSP